MTISISAQCITSAQIKDGRELLDWTKQKLAEKADLSLNTVRRIELGEAGRGGSIEKAAYVLRSSGIELVPGGGVRLMPPGLRFAVLGDGLDAGSQIGTAAAAEAFDSITHEEGCDVGAERRPNSR
jgi:transcriptional regulator with XRE-family HTH domain